MAPTRPLVYQKPILTPRDEPAPDILHDLDLVLPTNRRLRVGDELDPWVTRWKDIPTRGRHEIAQLFKGRQ